MVLVGCEESQSVTISFRRNGIKAFSCDTQKCSGGHPEWHIKGNVIRFLKNWPVLFFTEDGKIHFVFKWRAGIFFPECTHLAVSGAKHFEKKRADGRQKIGIDFFMGFVKSKIKLTAIENPIGIMSTLYRKPDQIIQPWMFGHGETKATCLWLKKLPKLEPTNIVDGREQRVWKLPPSKNRAKLRSKTYTGIAEAMAQQWYKHIKK